MVEKTFTIDYDNPSELKKLITKLQKRRKTILRNLGYNEINFNSSKFNIDNLLPILNSFIDRINIKKGNYYIYFHCNPLTKLDIKSNIKDMWLALKFPLLNNKPFYVGKGIKNRAYDLSRNDSHRKIRSSIKKYNKDIDVKIVIDNISEESALFIEGAIIEVLGLKSLSNTGYLVNLDEGKDRLSIRETYPSNMLKVLKSNKFYISENMRFTLKKS